MSNEETEDKCSDCGIKCGFVDDVCRCCYRPLCGFCQDTNSGLCADCFHGVWIPEDIR